ncbi:MAG: hypothetical protein M3Z33_01900 [Actinomycetota bacterium]|nr:hypothetical protein [Actinomycetota bacterium]
MSKTLLIVCTVAEIVGLVVVLCAYLIVVAKQLRSIASTLSEVTWGARAVERQLRATRSNIGQINWALEDIAAVLPDVADKAEDLSRGPVRS